MVREVHNQRNNSASLKHACPKGIYLAPSHDRSAEWLGVLFVRKGRPPPSAYVPTSHPHSTDASAGPYASAALRFSITFPQEYPAHPPTVAFLTDVFHPLITPLTAYTHTTTDTGTATVSAADSGRLPPGGLTLRHGFPAWLASDLSSSKASHIVQVLMYLRTTFESEALLDSIPLDLAANTGAWHAWHSSRSSPRKTTAPAARQSTPPPGVASSCDARDARDTSTPGSRQQPGGARGPAEWDWTGVWDDRVRQSVQRSIGEAALQHGLF